MTETNRADKADRETIENTLRTAQGWFPGIIAYLKLVIEKLSDYSDRVYAKIEKEAKLNGTDLNKIPVSERVPFQVNCFVEASEHLLKLSEETESLIKRSTEEDTLPVNEILSGLERFDTLFRQFVLPDASWEVEERDTIVRMWRELNEQYRSIKENADRLRSSAGPEDPAGQKSEPLASFTVKTENGVKRISVVHGDLCKAAEEYDLVVCSAWKNSYKATEKTLIGSLLYEKNISVYMLEKDCELDYSKKGVWLSKETGTSFHRIACIELLEYSDRENMELVNIKSVFSTLSYIVEQAAIAGIPVRRIALPILGTGRQKIDVAYILSPLVTYCLRILQCLDETEEIVFYELDEERACFTADRLRDVLKDESGEDVFISYSSKQQDIAMKIYDLLTANHIKCWMAPQSIPAGSQYYIEITKAIRSVKITLLLLTQDAVESFFVPKELSSSLGSRKRIVPFQVGPVRLENGFEFLLQGEQIKPVGDFGRIDTDFILKEVQRKLLNN